MKDIFILYMPPGNHEAMVHYQDTIVNKVSQELIFKYVDQNLRNVLRDIFGNKPITVWGSRSGMQNRSRFENMKRGDDVLIVEGDTIKLLGKIAATTINEELSCKLWKNLDDKSKNEPWKLIYFIANPVEINVKFEEFKKLFNYESNWSLRGFTNVSEDRLGRFYLQYDDLYSVLLKIKEGQEVKKISEKTDEQDHKIKEEIEKTDEQIDEKMDEDEVSDHVRMQWKILSMGLKSGTKVWVPKNDQNKI